MSVLIRFCNFLQKTCTGILFPSAEISGPQICGKYSKSVSRPLSFLHGGQYFLKLKTIVWNDQF